MHDLGGLVIVNHIYNSPEENSLYPTRQQLYDWGVDYFETYNGGILDTESAAFSQLHNMGEIAGTDSHGPDTTYTWNAMNVEFTEEAIFEALRKKETTVLYNASGLQSYATPIPNPYYIPLKPLAMLGNAIESYYIGYFKLDWIGIFVLVGYLYGGFFAYYGLGTLKQKFWEKRTRAK
jgi:hypothetical protein